MVKPAPPSVLDYLDSEPLRPYSDSSSHWTNSGRWGNVSRYHDLEEEEELPVDYAFLDEDEEVDYNSVDGFSLRSMRRRRREAGCETCVRTGAHIVFKRRDVRDMAEEMGHGHGGDYSEFTAFLIFMGSENQSTMAMKHFIRLLNNEK